MATANANRSRPVAVTLTLPECPVCMEIMKAPIFQCLSGHSLCDTCTKTLMTPICPICRQAMTQIRNRQLEEMIATAKVPCPNKSSGCVYIMANMGVEDHLKECIFRKMDCPHGAVFGRCSWNGKLNEMMNHFKECHPKECNVSSDSDVMVNVSLAEDDRHMYLTAQAKFHFIITMKIDTQQKMAYWTIQHIGGKTVANQHIYEIHITSMMDSRRKVAFTEQCFNDAVKADEVMRQGKCAVLPLDVLKHFVKNRNLTFRFFIKRLPSNQNKDNDDVNKSKAPQGPRLPRSRSQGPGAGPKGPGPKLQHKIKTQ